MPWIKVVLKTNPHSSVTTVWVVTTRENHSVDPLINMKKASGMQNK